MVRSPSMRKLSRSARRKGSDARGASSHRAGWPCHRKVTILTCRGRAPCIPGPPTPPPSALTNDAFGEPRRGACLAGGPIGPLGRPLHRIELGRPGAPAVLLTALMHGVEWIGAVALLECLRALTAPGAASERILARSNIVVVPIVNPDALYATSALLARGLPAWQRGNARGVDLNRNFPVQPVATPSRWGLRPQAPWHLCSGSRRPLSPYYMGPAPLSEPESRAVHEVAAEVRPFLSLAFHSFGEMLLYPYACSRDPHPAGGRVRAARRGPERRHARAALRGEAVEPPLPGRGRPRRSPRRAARRAGDDGGGEHARSAPRPPPAATAQPRSAG